jgi:hypothetical protein
MIRRAGALVSASFALIFVACGARVSDRSGAGNDNLSGADGADASAGATDAEPASETSVVAADSGSHEGGSAMSDVGVGSSSAPMHLAAGESTCVVMADGTIECWGNNAQGQLGRGTLSEPVPTPAPVVGLPAKAVEIAHRGMHTCARLVDGRVFCWGAGDDGLLGGGAIGDDAAVSPSSGVPIEIPGAKGALEISTGGHHDCARFAGEVRCWGLNRFGQLGDGTHARSNVPRVVTGLGPVAQLSLGDVHSCARLVDGRVACWGWNLDGALGQPASTTESTVPMFVPGLDHVVELSTAGYETCARRSDGDVTCWGKANRGDARFAPTPVPELAGAQRLALGVIFSTALFADGSVRQWGTLIRESADAGLVDFDYVTVPVIAIPSGATEIASGWQHACARLKDSSIWCWGDGLDGYLGNAREMHEITPTKMPL